MGTTDNFDVPASALPLAATDRIPILSASTGRGAYVTGDQLAAGVAGATVVLTAGVTVLAVTQAAHANRVVIIASTTPIAVTLPVSSGSGARYTFVLTTAATATSHTIKASTTQVMQGQMNVQTTSNAALLFSATATDNTVSMNGTTTGGLFGAIYEFIDVKTGIWEARLRTSSSGATATPFSAT